MTLYLRDDLARAWDGLDPFEQAARQRGDVFRAREGRRTLRFEAGGRHYFLKYHAGIGWQEIVKNLSQAKLPILGPCPRCAPFAPWKTPAWPPSASPATASAVATRPGANRSWSPMS